MLFNNKAKDKHKKNNIQKNLPCIFESFDLLQYL